MSTVALFVIVRNWKQPRSPSRDQYIYTMESYTIIKSYELLVYSTKGIHFKIDTLCERRKYTAK